MDNEVKALLIFLGINLIAILGITFIGIYFSSQQEIELARIQAQNPCECKCMRVSDVPVERKVDD